MENKTIKQNMDEGHLAIGGFLYSYGLGFLTKYELIKIVESQYNDEKYAVMKPIESMDYEHKRWYKIYDDEPSWLRANIRHDIRFNIKPIACLEESIKSLQKHIASSTWQKSKAGKILENLKS